MKIPSLSTTETSLLRQLARGTSISFFFGIGGYFFMILFKFVAARHYGPEDLGLFEMTNTILLILIVFSTFGIPAGISRYIPLYKHQNEPGLLSGYIRFILFGTSILSVIIALALFFLAETITHFFQFPSQLEPLIQITSFIIPLRTLSYILRKIFIAEKKIFFQTLSESILEKFSLLIFLSACVLWNLPLLFVVLSLLAATLISLSFDIFIFSNKINFPKEPTPIYRHREWIAFSLPLLLSGFFTFFIQWSDNILVGKFLSASFLGIYALAYSIGDFIGFLQIPFLSIFTPLTAENYATQEKNSIGLLFSKTVAWLFMLGFGFVILFILLGKEFLSHFFGIAFAEGYIPLTIISTGLLFYNIFSISEAILILHKKTRLVFVINFCTATFNIILNIFFIHFWGIFGAATASAIAINLKGLITFFSARKKESLHLPFATIIAALIAGGTAFILSNYIKNMSSDPLFIFIIIPIIIIATYVFALISFRAITHEDKMMFRLFMKRLRAQL